MWLESDVRKLQKGSTNIYQSGGSKHNIRFKCIYFWKQQSIKTEREEELIVSLAKTNLKSIKNASLKFCLQGNLKAIVVNDLFILVYMKYIYGSQWCSSTEHLAQIMFSGLQMTCFLNIESN